MNFGAEAVIVSNQMLFVMVFGVVLCSLLCVVAALRNNGEVLQKTSLMLACQAYIMLTALMHLGTAPEIIISQVLGFVTLALGIAPIIFKKSSFRGARYCIALGALLAACTILLF